MHQVRLLILLLSVAMAGCVVPKHSQPADSTKPVGLANTIQQAQLQRLDILADTAAKCRNLSSEDAKKTWEAGFAEAQTAVDNIAGPAISKAMDAAGDDKSSVWEQIENGYRPQ